MIARYGQWVGITQEKIDRVHGWFKGIGHWVLVVGYFVPGVRHVTAIVAGVSGFELAPFALFAYTGALAWVSTFLGIGYFVGKKWKHVSEVIHENLIVACFVLAIVLVGYLLARYRLRNRQRLS